MANTRLAQYNNTLKQSPAIAQFISFALIVALVVIFLNYIKKMIVSMGTNDADDVYAGASNISDAERLTNKIRSSFTPEWNNTTMEQAQREQWCLRLVSYCNELWDNSEAIISMHDGLNGYDLDAIYWTFGARVYDGWTEEPKVLDIFGHFNECVKKYDLDPTDDSPINRLKNIWANAPKNKFK